MQFTVSDYIQVGSTNKNCLKILPSSDKSSFQKFVIGDETGIINGLEFTKNEIAIKFNTSSFEKEITRIELTGSTMVSRDKICASGGSLIRCFSSKGKEFFSFDTNQSEAIKCLGVEANLMWTTGEHLMNEYESQKDTVLDKYYYVSSDKINDMYIMPLHSPSTFNPLLACQDNTIRILENGKEKTKYITSSSPNCLSQYNTKPYSENIAKFGLEKNFIIGFVDGSIANINFGGENPVLLWNLKNSKNSSNCSVTMSHVYDFTKNGANDLFIVREDGSFEFYALNIDGEMEIQYKEVFNEAITGVDCGNVSKIDCNEYILSTYSGKIFGLCEKNEKGEKIGRPENKKEIAAKIKNLRDEIDQLKKNIEEASNAESADINTVGVPQPFKLNHKFLKNSEDATYSIHIDSQISINFILIHSDLSLEIMDNKNPSIISSISQPSEENEYLQGTYRFTETNIFKCEIRLRTLEGKSGAINLYVVPNSTPKSAQKITINIKALSLHEKIMEEINENELPLNTLNIEGDFNKNDMQLWVGYLLNDPPKISEEEEEVTFVFKSVLVGTILIGKYSKGKSIFKSDSISTIMIVKEVISHAASTRSINIITNWMLNDQSVSRVLLLLSDKFEYHNQITKQYQLLPALKELQLQEGNLDFMSEDYKEILSNSDKIKADFEQQPKRLHYLRGVITDLYYDRATFKGLPNVNQKIKVLIQALNNFNLENVIKIFELDQSKD